MKYREFTKLLPGGEAVLDVDLCVLNDNLSAETIGLLRNRRVFDNNKVVIIIDQIIPPNSPEQSGVQRQLMKLAAEQQIRLCFGRAMTGQWLCDGNIGSGQIVAAANKTVVAASVAGACGLYVPEERIMEVFEKGQVKITVPERLAVCLKGQLSSTFSAKDAALALVRKLGAGSQQGKILSIYGAESGCFGMGDLADFSITAMAAGAETVVFHSEPDLLADDDGLSDSLELLLDGAVPLAAVDNDYQTIEEIAGMSRTEIQVVYIGGSAGGNFRDMKIVADAVRGKQIAYGVRLSVAPATAGIYQRMADAGYIGDILDAGGLVLNQCADADIQCRIGEQETMVSNDWKNMPGYAGYESSRIIIASTAGAAAAALNGYLGGGEIEESKEEQPAGDTPFVLEGRCWKFGDDIDTDIIIPTQYVCIPYEEMLQYAFAPLRPDLAAQLQEGDIIVAGENFGCGSSREMAAEVIAGNGVKCIIAKSFARIFFRNAINNGILLIECPELPDEVNEGDIVRVELNRQILCNGKSYPIGKIMANLYEIIADGGLVKNIEKKVRLGLL